MQHQAAAGGQAGAVNGWPGSRPGRTGLATARRLPSADSLVYYSLAPSPRRIHQSRGEFFVGHMAGPLRTSSTHSLVRSEKACAIVGDLVDAGVSVEQAVKRRRAGLECGRRSRPELRQPRPGLHPPDQARPQPNGPDTVSDESPPKWESTIGWRHIIRSGVIGRQRRQ